MKKAMLILLLLLPVAQAEWISPDSAEAQSIYSSRYDARRSIDGNNGTGWFSEFRGPLATITYDMEEVITTNKVSVHVFPMDLPTTITISASEDGTQFNQITDEFTLISRYAEIPFDITPARYLKIEYVKRSRPLCGCAEFRVFEAIAIDPDRYDLLIEYEGGNETRRLDEGLVSLSVTQNGTHIHTWWTGINNETRRLLIASSQFNT